MIIREALESDIENLIQIAQKTILKTCVFDYSEPQLQAWANRLNRVDRFKLAIKEQYFIIAEIDGEMVGFGSIKDGNYLDFLYVSPLHLRKGIACKIYDELLEKATELNQIEITSNVSKTAAPFFVKQGFKVIKEQENSIYNEVLINYKMKLSL